MDEDNATGADGVLDEAARDREMDEEVGIIDVLDADAEVADSRGRVVCWNGL